jgi:hypothetical protein
MLADIESQIETGRQHDFAESAMAYDKEPHQPSEVIGKGPKALRERAGLRDEPPSEKAAFPAGEIIGKGPKAIRERIASAARCEPVDVEVVRFHATKRERDAGVMAYLLQFWRDFERCDGQAGRLRALRNAVQKKFADVPNSVLEGLRDEFDRMKERTLETKILPCALCPNPSKDRHHVLQLQFGGPNHLVNLIGLCDACHSKVHRLP